MEILIVTLLIIISASIHIRAEYTERLTQIFIFKPLTVGLIACIGISVLPVETGWYHYAILLGLLFSIGGDVALMLPSDKFLIGLVSFLIGHLFYISGLISGIQWFETWIVWGLLLLAGTVVFISLKPHLGSMQLPVLFYVLVIMIMSATAWERHLELNLNETLFAAFGASMFMVSDSLLAWNRFRQPFKSAQLFVLSTYYLAQWMIAYSLSQASSSIIN